MQQVEAAVQHVFERGQSMDEHCFDDATFGLFRYVVTLHDSQLKRSFAARCRDHRPAA